MVFFFFFLNKKWGSHGKINKIFKENVLVGCFFSRLGNARKIFDVSAFDSIFSPPLLTLQRMAEDTVAFLALTSPSGEDRRALLKILLIQAEF